MQKKENIRLFISLGLAGGMILVIVWALGKITSVPLVKESPSSSIAKNEQLVTKNPTNETQARMSLGDKILVTADTNPDKQAGVQAFAVGDFATALDKFQASLQTNRNDPEALIYLNNAKIGKSQALKVVVSVPISGILKVSREVLRGVAQAQDEVNKSGGINGVPLQLEIANDQGDLNITKLLAAEFVKDSSILAVIGHNRPDISDAAGQIYNQGGLVMVNPASNTSQVSGGKYIFSISANTGVFANTLARYIAQNARVKNIAICADSTIPAFKNILNEYTKSIRQAGSNITNTVCDFSVPDFNPSNVMGRAISDGSESLLLLPRLDKIDPAIDVARANSGRLALFTYGGMYTFDTLKKGRGDFKGMVLPVFWHPDAIPGNPFGENAAKLWGGPVNARTATSYDAAQAIIAGLKQGNTRSGLQKALVAPNLSATGATGRIQFLPSGERKGTALLVKIEPGQISGTGYDFVLVR